MGAKILATAVGSRCHLIQHFAFVSHFCQEDDKLAFVSNHVFTYLFFFLCPIAMYKSQKGSQGLAYLHHTGSPLKWI